MILQSKLTYAYGCSLPFAFVHYFPIAARRYSNRTGHRYLKPAYPPSKEKAMPSHQSSTQHARSMLRSRRRRPRRHCRISQRPIKKNRQRHRTRHSSPIRRTPLFSHGAFHLRNGLFGRGGKIVDPSWISAKRWGMKIIVEKS